MGRSAQCARSAQQPRHLSPVGGQTPRPPPGANCHIQTCWWGCWELRWASNRAPFNTSMGPLLAGVALALLALARAQQTFRGYGTTYTWCVEACGGREGSRGTWRRWPPSCRLVGTEVLRALRLDSPRGTPPTGTRLPLPPLPRKRLCRSRPPHPACPRSLPHKPLCRSRPPHPACPHSLPQAGREEQRPGGRLQRLPVWPAVALL